MSRQSNRLSSLPTHSSWVNRMGPDPEGMVGVVGSEPEPKPELVLVPEPIPVENDSLRIWTERWKTHKKYIYIYSHSTLVLSCKGRCTLDIKQYSNKS